MSDLIAAAQRLQEVDRMAMNHQDIQNAERAVLEAARMYGRDEEKEEEQEQKQDEPVESPGHGARPLEFLNG